MKKERVLCPAVKITFPNNGQKDEVIVPYVKNHNEEYHVFLLLIKLGIWRSTRYREEFGFVTSEQRFVDPVEALKITGWGSQMRFRGVDSLSVEEFYRY